MDMPINGSSQPVRRRKSRKGKEKRRKGEKGKGEKKEKKGKGKEREKEEGGQQFLPQFIGVPTVETRLTKE